MEISLGAQRSDRSFCVRPSLSPCCGKHPWRQRFPRGSGIFAAPHFRLFQQYPSICDIKSGATTFRFRSRPALLTWFWPKATKGQAGPRGSHQPPHEPLPEPRIAVSRLKRGSLIARDCSASAMGLPREREISNSAAFDAGREPRQGCAPWGGAAFAIRSTRLRRSSE